MGGDASLRTERQSWEGGQSPRDRVGSWAEAKAEAVGVDEITKRKKVWGEENKAEAEDRALGATHG